jgi:glycosyltransferase involved in cell wall biosynthesis
MFKYHIKIAQIGSRGIPGHRGGVERVIEAVAPRLVRLGHQVIVYCASWSTFREPVYKGVNLRYAFSIRTKHLDTFVRSLVATLREIFGKSDIVHFHSSGSAPLALLCRLLGKKVVVTVHGLDWQRRKWGWFGQWFLQLGELAAVRVPNRTVVVGMDLKRALDSRYGCDVTYIPNGVEERESRAADKIREFGVRGRDFILYLARLVPEKQCHVLIDAFKRLPDAKGLKLVIAGPTWHSEDYVAMLRKLAGDDPRIVFTGEVDEQTLEELYSNCYAYVLPSEVEGMSLSLLDAMAFGACIVTSDIAANADVIGGAGLTFSTGSPESLAEKLRQVLANPDQAQAFRVAAKARMTSEFHWDRVAERWESLYLQMLCVPDANLAEHQ